LYSSNPRRVSIYNTYTWVSRWASIHMSSIYSNTICTSPSAAGFLLLRSSSPCCSLVPSPFHLSLMVRTTEWAFCVETVLGGYGLVTHLIGTCPTATSDGSNSAAITTWLNDDGRVKSAIVTSMKPSLMMSLQPYKTAKEMWDYLQKRYVQVSGAHLHTLMQGLRGLQQDELSIDDYYAAFDRFMGPVLSMVPASTAACEGCSKKTKFIEQFLMYQFVMGLRSEFEPVRAQLLNQTVSPSMSDVLASLTAEETRLRSLSPARSVLAPHSVLAAP